MVVGRFFRDGLTCYLDGASVVRSWGTTRGIGELCMHGPTPQTVLDPVPRVEWHQLTEVCKFHCNDEVWREHVR